MTENSHNKISHPTQNPLVSEVRFCFYIFSLSKSIEEFEEFILLELCLNHQFQAYLLRDLIHN